MQWWFLLVFQATLFLPIARVRLLRLFWSFGAFEPGSLQQRLGSLPSLSKLFAHGAKTVLQRCAGSLAQPIWAQTSLPRAVPKEIQLWDSYQLPWRDLVPNRFVYKKIWLFSLVVWNFMASGQWHLFPRQPLCSYCFACLESYRKSLEYRTGAAIEGVIARCTGCSSKPWRQFGTFWIGSLHQAACSRLNLCKGGTLRSWWPPRFKSKETMEIGLNRLLELTPAA